MRIGIIGGGNLGYLNTAKLSLKHDVILYTTKSEIKWSEKINVYNEDENFLFQSGNFKVTSDLDEAIEHAEVIISTYPSNLTEPLIERIERISKDVKYVLFEPGFGGKEFMSRKLIDRGITIVGLQRVHSIARIKEQGKSVYQLGMRKCLYVASIPQYKNIEASKLVESFFDIKTEPLNNYLCVTLTPSNPILHPSRLHNLFKNRNEYDNNPLFYEEWNDETSKILLKCDAEAHQICNKLDKVDLRSVMSLKDYYESDTPTKLTLKIKSIDAFKGIYSPVILNSRGKYEADLTSRYFTEDFTYGLLILKGFAEICQVETKSIDEILYWFQDLFNKEYIVDGKLTGKNLNETAIPQNYGIMSIDDIYKYYLA